MTNREAIKYLRFHCLPANESLRGYKAVQMAISALKKQEVDKCCETCKYKHLDVDACPCCDCIRAKDHYVPYTEEES